MSDMHKKSITGKHNVLERCETPTPPEPVIVIGWKKQASLAQDRYTIAGSGGSGHIADAPIALELTTSLAVSAMETREACLTTRIGGLAGV